MPHVGVHCILALSILHMQPSGSCDTLVYLIYYMVSHNTSPSAIVPVTKQERKDFAYVIKPCQCNLTQQQQQQQQQQ